MSLLPIPEDQPFIMGILGRRQSGKGFLVLDLLKYFYKGSFDFLIWISPTFQLQDMCLNIEDSTGIIVFSEWRPEIITALFDYMNERNKGDREGRKTKEQCLLVLDDVGLLSKKGKLSEQLDNIAFVSRHYGVSVIEIAQRITLLTTSVRSQLDCLLLFREQNPQERLNLFRSFGFCEKKSFFDTLDRFTEEKYSFVGIRNLAGKLCFFDLNGEIHPICRTDRSPTRTDHSWNHSRPSIRDSAGYQSDLRRLGGTYSNDQNSSTVPERVSTPTSSNSSRDTR